MPSFKEQMQRLAREYKRSNGVDVIDLDKVCDWALQEKKWEPQPVKLRRIFKEELSTALREEYTTDPQGRRVHVNHRVVERDKNGKQLSLIGDRDTSSREFLQRGFMLRRKQSSADLRQLKWDTDSVNENRFSDNPIPMQYDFTKELMEEDLLRVKRTSSSAPKRPSRRSRVSARRSASLTTPSRP